MTAGPAPAASMRAAVYGRPGAGTDPARRDGTGWETVPPIIGRGVLVDVPLLLGVPMTRKRGPLC